MILADSGIPWSAIAKTWPCLSTAGAFALPFSIIQNCGGQDYLTDQRLPR